MEDAHVERVYNAGFPLNACRFKHNDDPDKPKPAPDDGEMIRWLLSKKVWLAFGKNPDDVTEKKLLFVSFEGKEDIKMEHINLTELLVQAVEHVGKREKNEKQKES